MAQFFPLRKAILATFIVPFLHTFGPYCHTRENKVQCVEIQRKQEKIVWEIMETYFLSRG